MMDIAQNEKPVVFSRILSEGVSRCESCGRYVPAQLIFEDGFTYVLQDCSFDKKKSRCLLMKGEWSEGRWKETPYYWPWVEGSLEKASDWKTSDPRRPILSPLLSTECSAHCRICRFITTRINKERHPGLDICAVKKMISAHRGKTVNFWIGEPTESEFLPELIAFAAKRGFITIIGTNGMKLSDAAYLRLLKAAGLRYTHMSFDGFDESIYERIRGGKYQYRLKLRALENLKNENMKTGIKAVLVRGLNENQVEVLLKYALKENFVTEVSFQSLSLGSAEEGEGFDRNNLLSVEEMKALINSSLKFSDDYFKLWDSMKINLASLLARIPCVRISPFELDAIYLLRKPQGFVPLLDASVLCRMISSLKRGGIGGIFSACACFFTAFGWFIIKEMVCKRRLPEMTDSMVRIKIRVVTGVIFFSRKGRLIRNNVLVK